MGLGSVTVREHVTYHTYSPEYDPLYRLTGWGQYPRFRLSFKVVGL